MKELSPTGFYRTWRLPRREQLLLPGPPLQPKEPEPFPVDYEKGWEHYRHFFRCTVCNEWNHEDQMKHRPSGGYICNECNLKIDQLIESL